MNGFKEFGSNVSGNIAIERWIEPYYISVPIVDHKYNDL